MMSSAKMRSQPNEHAGEQASEQSMDPPSQARERWSCFMDGEADDATVSDCLREWAPSSRDAAGGAINAAVGVTARSDWELWHAAGDALRSSEVAACHSDSFSLRFASALAAEPAIIARPRSNRRLITRVMLPGAAVAAAAAMLTVVALPVLRGGSDAGPGARVLSVQQQSVRQLQSTTIVQAPTPLLPAATTVAVNTPPPHIDSYIAAHRELASSVGMARATPYLRTTTVLPER